MTEKVKQLRVHWGWCQVAEVVRCWVECEVIWEDHTFLSQKINVNGLEK